MRRARIGLVIAGGLALTAAALWWVARSAKPQAPPPRQAAQVVGRVELAAGAAASASAADATVVVYAYALDGPRVPLAVLRRPASTLPFDFKLDDSLAPQLVIGARLGPGDAASPQPGDWLAASQTVPANAHGVRLGLQPPRR